VKLVDLPNVICGAGPGFGFILRSSVCAQLLAQMALPINKNAIFFILNILKANAEYFYIK
jgi:hypothetical protein